MWECRTIARSPTGSRSAMADGDEVERPVEVTALSEPEVSGGDRRHESGIERLRQPQRRVDPIPPGAQRDLVDPELAGMEDPQDLHPAEVGREKLSVLGQGVLAEVPRVLRLLRAGRSQGQPVRR